MRKAGWCLSAGAALIALALSPHDARAGAWPPVDPAELALKFPTVQPGADAQVLQWDIRVEDLVDGGGARVVLDHYVRTKIFTDRGRETQSTVTVPYTKGVRISDVEGRTIKPDGTIVPLAQDAVFDRVLLKAAGLQVRVKSFAMPAVEPGAILEYRYREMRFDQLANYVQLPFQRDVPIQNVTYHIKPLFAPGYVMQSRTFHGVSSPFKSEGDGFFKTTATDLPGSIEEPFMPPDNEVRMWMLVYYKGEYERDDPATYWRKFGRAVYEAYRPLLRPTAELRQAAADGIGDATTEDEKLARLFDFVRKRVKNTSLANEPAIGKVKANRSPGETLARGIGTSFDVNMLFAALAASAGFDARVANLSDRGVGFFDPKFANAWFLRADNIAIRAGGAWRFFDPGSALPMDLLRWQEEGQQALISDPKEPMFVETPMAPPIRSLSRRSGVFRLDAEGTLEGDLRYEASGHTAASVRSTREDMSLAQQQEAVREEIRSRMGTAEVTAITFENAGDATLPLVTTCHVKVPDYAQRVGKRLLVSPAFFKHGRAPVFTSGERRHPIYFHYPWAEQDSVQIRIPDNFTLDSADSPAPVRAEGVSEYRATVGITADGAMLHYWREFQFGKGGVLSFPANAYKSLKGYFDLVAERDAHTLTLKAME